MLVFRVAGAQSIEPSSGMRAMELVVAKNKPKSEWRQPKNRNEMNLSKGCQNVSFKYVYFIVLARARVFIYSHSDLYGFALCNSALEDVDRHWTLNLAGKWNRKVPQIKVILLYGWLLWLVVTVPRYSVRMCTWLFTRHGKLSVG